MSSSATLATKENETLEETLGRHKVRLEASLGKLRKALTQWHNYNAEYEALSEGLSELPEGASREDMLQVGKNFGGTVIDTSEVQALLGDKVGIRRTRDQVIEAINHRITYVTENISRVEKQIDKGEFQLSSLYLVQGDHVMTEEGDPVIEITEELDEYDNILSTSTSIPGGGQATKMNIKELNKFEKFLQRPNAKAEDTDFIDSGSPVTDARSSEAVESPHAQYACHSNEIIPEPTQLGSPFVGDHKKEVRFVGIPCVEQNVDTSDLQKTPVHEIRLDNTPRDRSVRGSPENEGRLVPTPMELHADANVPKIETSPSLMEVDQKMSQNNAARKTEAPPLKEEDFVLMVDEPPDEADLRRQMVDYNLHDVRAIVAELTLEEGSDFGDDYNDGSYDEGEEDEEDKYGRSTSKFITEDMYEEMRALEARIKARQEQKKTPVTTEGDTKPEKTASNAMPDVSNEQKASADTVRKKKGVRFAEKLDVAPSHPPPPPTPEPMQLSRTSYTLPPLSQPDPDDALPFLVELLARQQMEEDLKAQGLDAAKLSQRAGNGEADIVEEQASNEKKLSVFRSRRAETSLTTVQTTQTTKNKEEWKPPLSSSIVERAPAPVLSTPSIPITVPPLIANEPPKKVSQFKAAKSVETVTQSAPTNILTTEPRIGIYENSYTHRKLEHGNAGEEDEKERRPILSPTVIERQPSNSALSKTASFVSEPDQLDPAIHRQEIAMEYFMTRNKLIQKEGGFLPDEEEQMYIPLDENTGERRKVSRFKAARLKGRPQ